MDTTGLCAGRSVIVTGAGRGIGREEALAFAREGASVVVNDVGSARDGSAKEAAPAQSVVDEIVAAGGTAVANYDDIADVDGAKRVVEQAVDAFGSLDVVVNNAGIVRDRMLVNMTVDEWDAVIRVHLRGTFCMSQNAAAYWRAQSKAGAQVDARIINTTSASGLFGNPGQINYGAAKAGIASFTIIASNELARYGVTVNAISPAARTRMTDGIVDWPDEDEGVWGQWDPANIAPVAVWLGSTESAAITGRVFDIRGGHVSVVQNWEYGPSQDKGSMWEPRELGSVIPDLVSRAHPNSAGPAERAAAEAAAGPV